MIFWSSVIKVRPLQKDDLSKNICQNNNEHKGTDEMMIWIETKEVSMHSYGMATNLETKKTMKRVGKLNRWSRSKLSKTDEHIFKLQVSITSQTQDSSIFLKV